MFARCTIIPVKKCRIDEALKRYEKSVVPAAKSQKGFKGIYVLTDCSRRSSLINLNSLVS